MAKSSSIEWTDATWNPWHGCVKVSPGCKYCYMYREKHRYGQIPDNIVRSKTTFYDPLSWKKPRVIFTCSWSDWFLEESDEWRDEAWEIIRQTKHHIYQILSKRPERISENLPADWGEGYENVWLGTSIENQGYVYRKDLLIRIPAKIRFISAEPLLGPINLGKLDKVNWVITGGESGPSSRPMDLNWVRSIRSQCVKANIPYFHKQNGGNKRVDGTWGGRELDGIIWNETPIV